MTLNPEPMMFPEPGAQGRYMADSALDLDAGGLDDLSDQVNADMRVANSERGQMVERANRAERAYNLDLDDDPIFAETENIQIPSSTARVDRVASELSGAFDRDGSPILRGLPLTNSMIDHAPHMERMFHQIMSRADAMRQIRLTIKRAVKVGTGVICTEIVSRPIFRKSPEIVPQADMMMGRLPVFQDTPEGEGVEYENYMVVRSVKVQDMYVSPINIQDVRDAAFVGERFQIPRWKFEDSVADGFYTLPLGEDGEPVELQPGFKDSGHGQEEEQRRTGTTGDSTGMSSGAQFYDLVRGWKRWKAPGDTHYSLYYVVFPLTQPHLLLRVKKSPYESLDRPPYTFWNVDEGDGMIFGRGYMELLQYMQSELNDLHSLKLQGAKRKFSGVWVAREGSALADTLEDRRKGAGNARYPEMFTDDDGDAEVERSAGVTTIHPDEVFITANPQQDLVRIPLVQGNPSVDSEESELQAYMDMATVDNSPLEGIRTAFEVRQAASQSASKLKQYLKMVASTGLRPMTEIMKAQVWDFLMPISELSDDIRWMEYGDKSYPITRTDFFNGIALEPAGTTTSADEMVALTNTASLVSEFIPMFIQIPGVVPDPPRAIREILKARARALGMQEFEDVFGLNEPTEQDMQKAIMYRNLIMGASGQGQAPGFVMPGGMMGAGMTPGPMGGNGGAVQGAPDPMSGGVFAAPTEAAEQDGGNLN